MNAPLPLDIARAAARGSLALPSVPRVVRRLIAELKNPDADVGGLVAELEQEPQLAARTLRIANSPYYCGRRSLANLHDAVVTIGTDALRTLVISCGLQAVFVEVPGVNLRQFWLDASLTANAARSLARLAGLDGEPAFLAGLLHASGHLILCRAFPQPMQQQLAGVAVRRGAALADAERAACGLAHPEVGAGWLDELGFPHEVVDAVALHLTPAAAPAGSLAPLLALATMVSASVEDGDSVKDALAKIDAGLIALSSLVPEHFGERFAPHYERLVEHGGDL
jgi:HD-like signal output (HDOD) protein